MNKRVFNQLGELQLGDLIQATWLDASRGKLETVEELREAGASGAEIGLMATRLETPLFASMVTLRK